MLARICIVLLVMAMAVPHCAEARKKSKGHNSLDTERALVYLFSFADQPIPLGSTCYGLHQLKPTREERYIDLITINLSVLDLGRNRVIGTCKPGEPTKCMVLIGHDYGEAVSSAEIDFDVVNDRVVPESVNCVISP